MSQATSTNTTPCLAFGATSITSSFVNLPKDDLQIEKVMQKPDVIGINNQEIDPDVKHSSADFKAGAGKVDDTTDPAINKFFSEPIIKINNKSMGPTNSNTTSSAPPKRKASEGLNKTGTGKKPKFLGRGIKFS